MSKNTLILSLKTGWKKLLNLFNNKNLKDLSSSSLTYQISLFITPNIDLTGIKTYLRFLAPQG